MNSGTAHQIFKLQELAGQNPEFQQLSPEHSILNERFLHVCQDLTEEQQAAIFDYIGLLIEIQNRMLAFVLENGFHTTHKK